MADKPAPVEPVKLTPAEKEALRQEKEARKLRETPPPTTKTEMGKLFKKGGYVKSADGCAQRGKTRGKML